MHAGTGNGSANVGNQPLAFETEAANLRRNASAVNTGEGEESMSVASPKPLQVLVYCASSKSCAPHFHEAAGSLGRAMAAAGHTLVYGGGAVGSMGAVADGALDAGGHVIGIIPRFMKEREWAHQGIQDLREVDDMHTRKRDMLALADAIVALPGGTGTFEELFESVTAKRLGLFPKPIIILNQGGFYDPMFELLERSVDERFMHENHREIWHAVNHVDEVLPAISGVAAWPQDAIEFATT